MDTISSFQDDDDDRPTGITQEHIDEARGKGSIEG
jgi:hypothetical protein